MRNSCVPKTGPCLPATPDTHLKPLLDWCLIYGDFMFPPAFLGLNKQSWKTEPETLKTELEQSGELHTRCIAFCPCLWHPYPGMFPPWLLILHFPMHIHLPRDVRAHFPLQHSAAIRLISDLEATHSIYIANEVGGGELQSSAHCRFQCLPELFIEQGCHSQGSLQMITNKEEA